MGFIAPGALSRSNGYQIKSKGPVDGRMTVDTLEDLTSNIWTEDYPVYEAMVVGVAQEDSLYMLKSGWNGEKYVLDPTKSENWVKIGVDENALNTAINDAYTAATAYTNTEIGKLSDADTKTTTGNYNINDIDNGDIRFLVLAPETGQDANNYTTTVVDSGIYAQNGCLFTNPLRERLGRKRSAPGNRCPAAQRTQLPGYPKSS